MFFQLFSCRPRRIHPAKQTFRPRLEFLEDRRVMAEILLVAGAGTGVGTYYNEQVTEETIEIGPGESLFPGFLALTPDHINGPQVGLRLENYFLYASAGAFIGESYDNAPVVAAAATAEVYGEYMIVASEGEQIGDRVQVHVDLTHENFPFTDPLPEDFASQTSFSYEVNGVASGPLDFLASIGDSFTLRIEVAATASGPNFSLPIYGPAAYADMSLSLSEPPPPENHPPTEVILSRESVFSSLPGAWIASVAVVDSDENDTHILAVDDSRFEIVSGNLFLKSNEQLDLATEPTVTLEITATDSGSPPMSIATSVSLTIEPPPTTWESDYQWAPNPNDVNADGVVTPLDGLLVLTELNAAGSYSLTGTTPGTRPPLFFDVSGDRHLAPLDALLVINYLNAGGEGELPEPEPPAEEVDASADYLSRSPHFSATWLLAWQELEHNARKSMNNQFKSGG